MQVLSRVSIHVGLHLDLTSPFDSSNHHVSYGSFVMFYSRLSNDHTPMACLPAFASREIREIFKVVELTYGI